MSCHRSQDEAPTDDLAMLQPGDLVSVHLVGPAGDEGLDHNRSKQSILVWVWICVGALRVVEGRL